MCNTKEGYLGPIQEEDLISVCMPVSLYKVLKSFSPEDLKNILELSLKEKEFNPLTEGERANMLAAMKQLFS